MRADMVVKLLGKELIGKTVVTPAMGEYPGGEAVVTELGEPYSDIVFIVEHLTWKDDEGCSDMGIFEYEEVVVL